MINNVLTIRSCTLDWAARAVRVTFILERISLVVVVLFVLEVIYFWFGLVQVGMIPSSRRNLKYLRRNHSFTAGKFSKFDFV